MIELVTGETIVAPKLSACYPRLFSSPHHFCPWQIIIVCASTLSISCLTEETTGNSRVCVS